MITHQNQPHTAQIGYTAAMGYWSLGVTLYKLLTNSMPYSRKDFDAFLQVSSQYLDVAKITYQTQEFVMWSWNSLHYVSRINCDSYFIVVEGERENSKHRHTNENGN